MSARSRFLGCFLATTFLLFSPTASAWYALGHELVAQIAYDNLQPATKKQVNDLVRVLIPVYPRNSSFVRAAIWADEIKGDDVAAFNSWHYINIPYIRGRVKWPHHKTPRVNRQNVVWAIAQSESVLRSSKSSKFEKALFLCFLIHFVGDIHQPLHTTNLYSRQFPYGDQGGNLYPVSTSYAKNLHSLWDQGVGLLDKDGQPYQANQKQIRELALKLQQKYPHQHYTREIADVNSQDWAENGYKLAQHFVYKIPQGKAPSKSYTRKAQVIAGERIALAGYRLAVILNQMYGDNDNA